MHFANLIFGVIAIIITALTPVNADCTAADRLAGAEGIITAYAQPAGPPTHAAFELVPFAPGCQTTIAPNGLPPILFADSGEGTVDFGTLTRDAFANLDVSGYPDFPANDTIDIQVTVTLGVSSIIPLPVAFSANVYLDYDVNCQIAFVRAFAQIPSEVLGIVLASPHL